MDYTVSSALTDRKPRNQKFSSILFRFVLLLGIREAHPPNRPPRNHLETLPRVGHAILLTINYHPIGNSTFLNISNLAIVPTWSLVLEGQLIVPNLGHSALSPCHHFFVSENIQWPALAVHSFGWFWWFHWFVPFIIIRCGRLRRRRTKRTIRRIANLVSVVFARSAVRSYAQFIHIFLLPVGYRILRLSIGAV